MRRTLAGLLLAFSLCGIAASARADGISLRLEIRNRAVGDLLVCRAALGATGTVVRGGDVVCGPSPIAFTGRRSGSFDCGGSPFVFGPLPGTTLLVWSFRGLQGTMRLVR